MYVGVQRAGGDVGIEQITNIRGPGNAVVSNADTGLSGIGTYCMGQGTFVCPIVYGVNPSNPNHLIAAGLDRGKMKVSADGGASWTNNEATDEPW